MDKEDYVAALDNYNQVMLMKQMLRDIKIEFTEPSIMYYDKKSTINMSKNLVLHSNTKHISIKYHVLREKAAKKEIRLEYVSTKDRSAAIFTQPLPKDTFEHLRRMLGVMPLPTSE